MGSHSIHAREDLYSELTIVVDGSLGNELPGRVDAVGPRKLQTVEVFFMESELEGLQITWYFLRHELFLNRSEDAKGVRRLGMPLRDFVEAPHVSGRFTSVA